MNANVGPRLACAMSLHPRIVDALSFAATAHEGIARKYTGDPYVQHLINVAEIVCEKNGSEDQIIAALLHDTIEDTAVTYNTIRNKFGLPVANMVIELTDVYTPERFPKKNRAERKRLEAQRLGAISKEAKLIKICDIADNTSDIVRNDPGFAVLYLKEKSFVLQCLGVADEQT